MKQPLLSELDLPPGIEAVLLLRRTGVVVDAVTRDSWPRDLMAVMMATLVGSVENLVEAVGHSSPESVLVRTENHLIFSTKVGARDLLAVIARNGEVGEMKLQSTARQVLSLVNGGAVATAKSRD